MDIRQIDKNFSTSFDCPTDIEWFSIKNHPFQIYGIFFSEEENLFRRMPKDIADATSQGVSYLSKCTAGGRVRFATDSEYIVLKVVEPFDQPFSHMTVCGKYGFTLFTNQQFSGSYMPQYGDITSADRNNTDITFDGIKYPWNGGEKGVYDVELFFPLYNSVRDVFIGIQKGCILKEGKPYKHQKPILFYGSSITQGACACKPADSYDNRLSRLLDSDIYNLGFSGSAKGEQVMSDYIASLDPSVFIMDYDHNAPNAEFLAKTHYPLYENFRKSHPKTPIIMMTMPTVAGYEGKTWHAERKKVIFENYNRAKANGDDNLYLVDCYGCFGDLVNGECGTVDDSHPDSLGFLRMAERVYPILDKILNNK